MCNVNNNLLVFGYGNPARGDDGIGPVFVERVRAMNIRGVDTDSNYQLTVEDAYNIAGYQYVFFVDALASGDAPFTMLRIDGFEESGSISSHSVLPGEVVMLAKELFHAELDAYLLGIRGYCFEEFTEVLSARACLLYTSPSPRDS